MPRPRKNYAGEKFGRLKIITRQENRVTCECSCGGPNSKNFSASLSNVLSGKTKSCGCLRAEWDEQLQERIKRKRKKEKSPEQIFLERLFYNMRSRCNYVGDAMYPHYGGLGVTICAEWDRKKDFLTWALPKYRQGDILAMYAPTQYCPENCVFVPRTAGVVHGVIKAFHLQK